ncbi:MAG: DinB family protein [Acidimicrobiales bacterium]
MTTSPTGTAMQPPERCEECGFTAAAVTPANAEDTVRALGRRYRAPLTRLLPGEDAEVLRRRPDPATWSALEYAGHVRDLIANWGQALHLAVTQDRPHLARPDPGIADRWAAEQDYNHLEPAAVADQLAANADRMAAKVATVGHDAWDRVVFFGEEEMTALALVQKVAHEGGHHLLDIGRSLRAARQK